MKYSVSSVVLSLFSLALISSCTVFQSGGQKQSGVVVGEVAGEPITLDELRANFHRSASSASGEDEEGLSEFLDLYLDYKAKLAVARDAGYYEDEEILAELAQYERQSAYPYWLEKRVRDELLDELVERNKDQVHVSHILISLPAQASPQDTLNAYNKLMEARERFEAGEDFDELSVEYSSSQRGQSMGGDLGYFSGGWSVKAFEDVAYNTPVGEASMPFRSSFGYHVLYVKDRMQRQSERRVSHIFFPTQGGEYTKETALAAAGEVYDMLNQGESWANLVNEYTHDHESRNREGDIGWVSTGRYNQTFTQAIMSMDEVGMYSEPFYSGYGVHIARLDSIKSEEDPAEVRAQLYERLKQLPRYRENREAVIKAVRKVGNERVHRASLEAFEKHEEANRRHDFANIEWPEELKAMPLYEINNHTYTIGDYISWLQPQLQNRYQHYKLDEFLDESADDQVVAISKQEFPEFKDLSESYIHGLVVFRVSEDSVWNYAQRDTAALKAIFEANQDDYAFDKRYRYVRLSAVADSTLDKAVAAYESGVQPDSLNNSIRGLIVRRDLINNLDEEPFTHLAGLAEGELTEYFSFRNRQTVLLLEEIQEPRPMTFDEAYNKLVAQYQPIREQEWLERTRQQYSVKPFYDRLPQAAE